MSVIIGLKFLGQKNFSHWPDDNWIEGSNDVMSKLSDELDLYFSGDLFQFSSPIHFQGTKFQKQVWMKLMEIPFGVSKSYLDIATSLNNAKAVRAVGQANSKNPISIIIPCHRVIGSKGNLIGFGGGIDRKSWLLNHENSFRPFIQLRAD